MTHLTVTSLPLYQSCLNGRTHVAELLLDHLTDVLTDVEQAQYLKLLGAQLITSEQDIENGLKYWKEALYLTMVKREEQDDAEISEKFEKSVVISKTDCDLCDIFHGLVLLESAEDLEKIRNNIDTITIQALMTLENLLGPSHPHTVQASSVLARNALEQGDLNKACRLFYHTVAANEYLDHTATALDYSSQLNDLLLNLYLHSPDSLYQIEDVTDILISLLQILMMGILKTVNNIKPDLLGMNFRHDSTSKLQLEQTETFMAYLWLIVDMKKTPSQQKKLGQIVHTITTNKQCLCDSSGNSVVSMLYKIATYNGQSAQSTLYFFQEHLFPHVSYSSLVFLKFKIIFHLLSSYSKFFYLSRERTFEII